MKSTVLLRLALGCSVAVFISTVGLVGCKLSSDALGLGSSDTMAEINVSKPVIAQISPVEENDVGKDDVIGMYPHTHSVSEAEEQRLVDRVADFLAKEAERKEKARLKKLKPEDMIWLGWTHFESGSNYAQAGGDGGHAYGRYQFDDRHGLAGFLQFCLERDPEAYASFQRYIRYDNAGVPSLTNLETLSDDWRWLCYLEGENFASLQNEYAILAYYEPVRQRLLEYKSIDLERYGPVLRGTAMSCSIRNGSYLENLGPLVDTYYHGISEREWLQQIYAAQVQAHPDQAERWGKSQLAAALEALTATTNFSLKVMHEHGFEEL